MPPKLVPVGVSGAPLPPVVRFIILFREIFSFRKSRKIQKTAFTTRGPEKTAFSEKMNSENDTWITKAAILLTSFLKCCRYNI